MITEVLQSDQGNIPFWVS